MARLLAEMKAAQTMIHDKRNEDYRPVDWGDIAILTRTWDSLDLFADALGSLGLPHVHAGGGSLMATREAKDGYALLRFLSDRTDNLALAAVLKSPFFSLSDVDLLELSQLPATSWWEALLSQANYERFTRPADLLQGLLDTGVTSPPSRLLHLADCDTGFSAVLANLPSGARRLADWKGFCDLVRNLESESFDVFGVARTLRRLETTTAHGTPVVTVARPALEAGNAISLMTVHRAKGLEWPIVVVADMASTPRTDASWMSFDPDIGVALKGDSEMMPHLVSSEDFVNRKVAEN